MIFSLYTDHPFLYTDFLIDSHKIYNIGSSLEISFVDYQQPELMQYLWDKMSSMYVNRIPLKISNYKFNVILWDISPVLLYNCFIREMSNSSSSTVKVEIHYDYYNTIDEIPDWIIKERRDKTIDDILSMT